MIFLAVVAVVVVAALVVAAMGLGTNDGSSDDDSPSVMAIADRDVFIGEKQIIPLMTKNLNMATMIYSMEDAPTDATMTKEGIVYWIPKTPGTYEFRVVVNDTVLDPVSTGVKITVSADPVQKAPVVEPIALGLALENVAIGYQVKAYDPNGDALTYSLSDGPEGVSISNTGMLVWTPDDSDVFTFDVEVSDGTASTSTTVTMTIVEKYDLVTRWNMEGASYINSKMINNQYGSRAMAMMHTAIFDAVNSIDPEYTAYNELIDVNSSASQRAAVAAAAHRVLTTLYPADAARFDALYDSQIANMTDDQNRTDGIEVGIASADAIIALRMNDHASEANTVYVDKTEPGQYRKTGMMNPLMPGWGSVTPWSMTSGSQFRLSGPPQLTDDEYTMAYNETKSVGARMSMMRTADQSEDALFWIAGVPDHFYGVARELSARYDLDLEERARLFALLTITLADASISGWDNKYNYTFWRPVTAIHDGELDGNPSTVEDDTWMPFITTPAFPEYASGHSTTCSAGATLLAEFFGTDDVTFVRMSATPGLPAHEYTSFSEIAEEAGASRIYAGVHFSFSNIEALENGALIAEYAYLNQLRPES
ncbi:MAG: phosphatase PAP2 family protein [Euryarchaeota archaeon]|nr:phosphatase PAP2 family protein [Euryarchaeota archaeon]